MSRGKKRVLLLLLFCAAFIYMNRAHLRKGFAEMLHEGRMKNVTVSEDDIANAQAVATAVLPSPSPVPSESPEPQEAAQRPTVQTASDGIVETTITGGLTIKNETSYDVNISALLDGGLNISLESDAPQVLIIHTHSSEAYTQAGLDHYEASDTNRTEDTEYNIVRVGDEMTKIFEDAGLNVIHDRGIYDYPSYTGSYTRSGAAIEQYLRDNPSIKIVIDMHRDALSSDGVVYKTMAEESGVCASQIMLLVGTDQSGLQHPNWRSNLALALYLQQAVNRSHPTLMRPVALVQQRYNQHLTDGSLILEVGSNGNTLQEALAAIRLFSRAAGAALYELVEK